MKMNKMSNDIGFQECCAMCLDNKELVKEFNRLKGLHLGERRSGIAIAIDDACGYNPDAIAIPEFVDFVYNYVWLPVVKQNEND